MPPRTLLSLLSKGKYETSEDLPTMPEMAHSYIDNIIESYEESKQYEPEVKGTGLGMLEWAAAPPVGKAGKLISSQIKPGSSEWKNIIQQLKLTTVFNPKEEEKFFAYLRKQRDFKLGRLNPTESKKMAEIESMVGGPKYKDAPHRELQDIVLKLDEMIIKTPKSKAIEEARYSLDKTLLRGMEHVEKYGWSSPAHDINTKNLYRTLIKLLEGKSTPFTKTTKKQGGGYITKPDVTRVNIPDDMNYSDVEYLPGFGIALDNIKNKKSLIEFVNSSMSSISGVDNMNTDLAKGLIRAWLFSGEPNVITRKGKRSGQAYFYRDKEGGHAVDVPAGDIVSFLAELAHSKQFEHAKTDKIKALLEKKAIKDKKEWEYIQKTTPPEAWRQSGNRVYDLLGTVEYNAHSIYEPYIRKRFFEGAGFNPEGYLKGKRRYGTPIHPGTPDH